MDIAQENGPCFQIHLARSTFDTRLFAGKQLRSRSRAAVDIGAGVGGIVQN